MVEVAVSATPTEIAAQSDGAVVVRHISGGVVLLAYGTVAPTGAPNEGVRLNPGALALILNLEGADRKVYALSKPDALIDVAPAATASGVVTVFSPSDVDVGTGGALALGDVPAQALTVDAPMSPLDLSIYVFPAAATWRAGRDGLPAGLSVSGAGALSGTPRVPQAARRASVIAAFDDGAEIELTLTIAVASA